MQKFILSVGNKRVIEVSHSTARYAGGSVKKIPIGTYFSYLWREFDLAMGKIVLKFVNFLGFAKFNNGP